MNNQPNLSSQIALRLGGLTVHEDTCQIELYLRVIRNRADEYRNKGFSMRSTTYLETLDRSKQSVGCRKWRTGRDDQPWTRNASRTISELVAITYNVDVSSVKGRRPPQSETSIRNLGKTTSLGVGQSL